MKPRLRTELKAAEAMAESMLSGSWHEAGEEDKVATEIVRRDT